MKHGYSSNITEITQQGSQEKHSFDISSPFNYTKFWSFIDEEFFSDLTESKFIYACQLIHYFSNIGIILFKALNSKVVFIKTKKNKLHRATKSIHSK